MKFVLSCFDGFMRLLPVMTIALIALALGLHHRDVLIWVLLGFGCFFAGCVSVIGWLIVQSSRAQ